MREAPPELEAGGRNVFLVIGAPTTQTVAELKADFDRCPDALRILEAPGMKTYIKERRAEAAGVVLGSATGSDGEGWRVFCNGAGRHDGRQNPVQPAGVGRYAHVGDLTPSREARVKRGDFKSSVRASRLSSPLARQAQH